MPEHPTAVDDRPVRTAPLVTAAPRPAGVSRERAAARGQGPALARTALVLAPRLGSDFSPRQFQAVLPKNFIHHAEPGGAVDRFFAAWHAAWQHARGAPH